MYEEQPVPQSDIDKLFSGEMSEREFERKWGSKDRRWLKRHLRWVIGSILCIWVILGVVLYNYLVS